MQVDHAEQRCHQHLYHACSGGWGRVRDGVRDGVWDGVGDGIRMGLGVGDIGQGGFL